jgi:4-hydroxy-tetrahydrodipicolinate reductase
MSDLERHIQKGNHTFFYASNFSLGVNILFLLNRKLANIMNGFRDYTVSINETHHTQKVDAPSGTAISLANDVIHEIARLTGWALQGNQASDKIPISSYRKGSVPGDHIVKYDSSHDSIELKHSAKTRIGFASGALLAAEYIQGKRGKYTMQDLLPL